MQESTALREKKLGWVFAILRKRSLSWKIASCITIIAAMTLAKLLRKLVLIEKIHNIQVLNELLKTSVEKRTRPIITEANHYGYLDDPLAWAGLDWSILLNPNKARWGFGADDILFTNKIYSLFFLCAKAIPIVRGQGVYQEAVDIMIDRLNDNEWVHVFPEGRINLNQINTGVRWGIGRMILEAKTPPILIPFWIVGLDEFMPVDRQFIYMVPFRKVTIYFGNPVDFQKIMNEIHCSKLDHCTARKQLADIVEQELYTVRDKAEAMHMKRLSKKEVHAYCEKLEDLQRRFPG